MVDIESDGPCPGIYSMVSLGAIVVEKELGRTFFAKFYPIGEKYQEEALRVCGYTREETLNFPLPGMGLLNFAQWITNNSQGRPIFISDNNGFDWQFVNYYFHRYLDYNPFGHSSQNLGSMYKGLVKDVFKNFKGLRDTIHTHNPVDDARGNAEALLKMKAMGLAIGL